MATSGETVAVSTTPTALSVSDADLISGQTLYLTNTSADTVVFLGAEDVADASNGYTLAESTSLPWPINLASGDELYAVVASGTADVAVVRTGV